MKQSGLVPARYGPLLFGFLLAGIMSFVVSGVATLRALGWVDGVMSMWMSNWFFAWLVAFPTVLVVRPLVARIVARLVE